MKILVTGSNGQLGSELQVLAKSTNHTFLFTDSLELDITDGPLVSEYFAQNKPNFCINCAAYTAVDKAESEKDLAHKINAIGAENLAIACDEVGAQLIQISTDFVFDGTASRPLKEDQPTSPVNYYGQSKLDGENKVAKALNEHFILRTSWLYSTFGGNFVKTMLRFSETKDELNIIADQIGTPTYARDLADTCMMIVESGSKEFGVYHYSNEGTASWYDFTKAIFEYANVSTKVNPIPTEQYPTPAVRPHYSVMNKVKIKEAFGMEISYWRESLKECLEKLK